MDKPYFSHDPENGVQFHATLNEARSAAETCIDEYRDACDPEWPEDVERVCFGIVLSRATEVVIREPGTDGPKDIGSSDYELPVHELEGSEGSEP